MTCLQYYARCGKSIKKKTIVTVHEKNQVFFHFFEKLGFSGTDRYKKEKNRMQKTKLHYLKQMWFYLHLANLILEWNSTKSALLNGHCPKLQFWTYAWFSHAQSQLPKLVQATTALMGWFWMRKNRKTSIAKNVGLGNFYIFKARNGLILSNKFSPHGI